MIYSWWPEQPLFVSSPATGWQANLAQLPNFFTRLIIPLVFVIFHMLITAIVRCLYSVVYLTRKFARRMKNILVLPTLAALIDKRSVASIFRYYVLQNFKIILKTNSFSNLNSHAAPPFSDFVTSFWRKKISAIMMTQFTQMTNFSYKRAEKSAPSNLITAYLSANLSSQLKGCTYFRRFAKQGVL